jgi:hypothetical protein
MDGQETSSSESLRASMTTCTSAFLPQGFHDDVHVGIPVKVRAKYSAHQNCHAEYS